MQRRAWLLALLGVLVATPGAGVPAAPSVALALSPKDQVGPLSDALREALLDSRRYTMSPAINPVPTDQPLDNVLMRLRKATKANWVFAGSLTLAAPSRVSTASPEASAGVAVTPVATLSVAAPRAIEVRGRLYDLVLGDATKELRFRGTEADWPVIARQVVLALKARTPLRGEVTGLRDHWLLLNLGTQDGVTVGDIYRSLPKSPQSEVGRPRLRIVEAQPWFCTAEVLDEGLPANVVTRRKPGVVFHEPATSVPPPAWRLIPGDDVVEDVGYSMIVPPKATGSVRPGSGESDEEGTDSEPAETEER